MTFTLHLVSCLLPQLGISYLRDCVKDAWQKSKWESRSAIQEGQEGPQCTKKATHCLLRLHEWETRSLCEGTPWNQIHRSCKGLFCVFFFLLTYCLQRNCPLSGTKWVKPKRSPLQTNQLLTKKGLTLFFFLGFLNPFEQVWKGDGELHPSSKSSGCRRQR